MNPGPTQSLSDTFMHRRCGHSCAVLTWANSYHRDTSILRVEAFLGGVHQKYLDEFCNLFTGVSCSTMQMRGNRRAMPYVVHLHGLEADSQDRVDVHGTNRSYEIVIVKELRLD